VHPTTAYHGVRPLDGLIMEDFDRAAPRGTGAAKVGGNYAPVMRWSKAAAAKGYHMTLHLDSATQSDIEEFSTSGFLGVKQSTGAAGEETVTLVVPDSLTVIDSVTSNSCMTLAKDMGWTVEKRRVPYTELPEFREVLAVGTAASIVPIKSMYRESSGEKFHYCPDGEAGEYGQALSRSLSNILKGDIADKFDWLHEVSGYPESPKFKLKINSLPVIMEEKLEALSKTTNAVKPKPALKTVGSPMTARNRLVDLNIAAGLAILNPKLKLDMSRSLESMKSPILGHRNMMSALTVSPMERLMVSPVTA
jgi:branched-chain amino acid aminotransferase